MIRLVPDPVVVASAGPLPSATLHETAVPFRHESLNTSTISGSSQGCQEIIDEDLSVRRNRKSQRVFNYRRFDSSLFSLFFYVFFLSLQSVCKPPIEILGDIKMRSDSSRHADKANLLLRAVTTMVSLLRNFAALHFVRLPATGNGGCSA